jgi:5-formyltetrahydrofolate cyclo-ligase
MPRHDGDAGGDRDVLAAKAALRDDVWSALKAAGASRFPGAEGRIPNFTGAETAAERLRATPQWAHARTLKGQPRFPAVAGAPARARGRQDGLHGGPAAGE